MRTLKEHFVNPPIACRQAAVAQYLLRESGRMLPDILGYLVNPAEVVILLPRRTRAPEGFQELDDGYAWLLTKSAAKELAEPIGGVATSKLLSPMVIHAGSHLETQSEMLLDVSSISHLSVKGATERVVSAMGSFAMDLLSNPFRTDLRIFVVGFGHELEMFPQVSALARQSDVSKLLKARSVNGASNGEIAVKTSVRRFEIVIDPFTEDPEKFSAMSGASLVTGFGSPTWSLDLRESQACLHPLDIRLERRNERSPSTVPYSTFQKLLPMHDAMEPEAMRIDGPLSGAAPSSPTESPKGASSSIASSNGTTSSSFLPIRKFERPSGRKRFLSCTKIQESKFFQRRSRFRWRAVPRDIRICVMGPVTVEGAAPFLSHQCVDFICYLAFHREGVTCDMVKESMWNNGSLPESRTITAMASRSRSALGTDNMNRFHIPRSGPEKVYRLSRNVPTDFDEFCWHMQRVRSNRPAAMVHLRRALRLVRGAPFSGAGRNRYSWADMSIRMYIECLIDDAAHKLADIALRFGDPDTARWACYQAHKVVPGCEQCYLRRFYVAYLDKNPAELRSAMSELQQIIRTDDGFNVSAPIAQHYKQLLDSMGGKAAF